MEATLVIVPDPFRPAYKREVKLLRRRRRLQSLAPKSARPMICLVNGAPVLRRNGGWKQCIKDGDKVAFISLPQGGGGGSNPLKIILAITVAVIAPYLGQMIAQGMMSAGIGLGGFGSTFAMGEFIGAAIGLGLKTLVNALIPEPSAPGPRRMGAISAPSPTYSIGAQGNQARIGQPIPVMYGRHVTYPDFIAQPYTEYFGNEQYLYQLFCIGQGEYQIEQIRLEDTVIESSVIADGSIQQADGPFEEIEYQVLYNQSVTMFPTNVFNSIEVAGQEVIKDAYVGPFVVNPAGTTINAIGFDLVLPKGLYFANDEGGLNRKSLTVVGEYRRIDDNGDPLTGWVALTPKTISKATTTPQRESVKFHVVNGRYEFRATRTDTKDTNVRSGHDVTLAGVRGYVPGSQNYGQITVLAMRMRASNNLSIQSSRRINVLATRKLRTWNGTSWTSPVATRSIIWAVADVAKSSYGMRLTDEMLPLDTMLQLNGLLTLRGDRFDGVFDSQEQAIESARRIARCGRSQVFQQGAMLNIVRDGPVSSSVQIFTMRNIVRGSFRMQYLMPSEQTADCIDVEYWDATTWQPKTVRCALPGSTQSVVSTVQFFGCTNRAQAYREGMKMAADNRYRRRLGEFETEMEGFIPTFGDLIEIQHDMPQWGLSGEVLAWDEESSVLKLSEPVVFQDSSNHYIALRDRTGRPVGPFLVSSTSNPKEVFLEEPLEFEPYTGYDGERTHFAFGKAEALAVKAKVMGIKPRGLHRVQISWVVESDFVHTADTGAVPGESAWQLPTRNTVPYILGLFAISDPDQVEKMFLSWQPAPGAEYYLIEVSDSGNGWTRIGETRTANYTAIAPYGARTQIRVAAVGATRGPWVEINYGSSASYMWSGVDEDLMWDADEDTLMWRY